MWLEIFSVATEEPVVPPSVPFETIGIVLVAMVTGLTGIIVALIQRGRNRPNAPTPQPAPGATPPNGSPVFVISKEDWDKVRDAVTRIDTEVARLRTDYDYHERLIIGEVHDLDTEVSRVKGHLGMS